MRHVVEHQAQRLAVSYSWWRDRRWETLAMTATGEPKHSATDSHEEFITEHYWGYTKRPLRTNEYRVEHERWRFWPAKDLAMRHGRGCALRRQLRSGFERAASLRVYRGRLFRRGPPQNQRNVPGATAARLIPAARMAEFRHVGSNRSRSGYRCAASRARIASRHLCAWSRGSLSGQAESDRTSR